MTRLPSLLWAAAFLAPAWAAAAPSISLLDPLPGTCVSAERPAQPSQAGVEPPFLPSDVELLVEVEESQGDPVTLVVRVDGVEVSREVFGVAQAAVPEAVTLRVPAGSITDGVGRDLRVEAIAGAQTASDQVTVTVDRRPPRVDFDPADLDNAGDCVAVAPAPLDVDLVDAVDAAPTSSSRWVADGCQLRFEVTASDHCGALPNTVVATYGLRRAPQAAPVITYSGVAEDEVTLRAVVDYDVAAGAGCVEAVSATLQRDGAPAGGVFDGAVLVDPGDYIATVTVDSVCSEEQTSASRHFIVVSGPAANAGGPYQTAQGVPVTLDASRSAAPPQAGGIVQYDWDLDNDGFYDRPNAGPRVPFVRDEQGDYQVWVRVTTGNGERAFDDAHVIVADPTPTCDAGGPYVIEQGQALGFDARATAAGAEDEPILAMTWDFGDGRFPQQGEGLDQPSHRYTDEGSYVVTLTAQDIDSSCTDTAQVTVRDVAPVIRNLHVLEDGLAEGETVQASAGQTSAGSAAEPLIDFTWTWGDDSPAETGVELRGPSHTYLDSGVFAVCLTVRDLDSETTDCVDVTVADLEPLAVATGPGFALEGESVQFDAAGTRPGGALDQLTRLTWDFGDGSAPVVRRPDELRVAHVFQRAGRLTVTLTVADEDSTTQDTVTIVVEDAEPQADLVAPPTGVEGVPMLLDASASIGGAASDPIAAYEWDFGDGETADGLELATVEHSFPDNGLYLVAVTVVDADGSRARRDALVEIANVAPTAVILTRTTPETPEVGRPVGFRVTYQDVPADPIVATLSFGDGEREVGPTEVEHTFGRTGRYRVVATLDDGDGGTATAELLVEVERPGPTISGPSEDRAVEGEPFEVQFDVRPAPDGAGGFDAPVTVRVPLLPPGAIAEFSDVRGDPPVRRVRVRYTPGFAQEGPHTIRVDARSASGLERAHELKLDVTDAGTGVLLGALGGRGHGEVSLFDWHRDAVTGEVRFERVSRTPLGEPAGAVQIGAEAAFGFVSLPASGRLGVVDLASGALVRRIPVRSDGRAPLLVPLPGSMHVLGAGDTLFRVDEQRLKLEGGLSLGTAEKLAAFAVIESGNGPEDARLVALTEVGTALYFWSLAGVVAGEGQPQARLSLDFVARTLAYDPASLSLLVADAKAHLVHSLEVGALRGQMPVASDLLIEVPGLATQLFTGADGGATWISTSGGLVRVTSDGQTLLSSRSYAGISLLPASLLGDEALALGGPSTIELQRVSDAAVLDVWRGNGAQRLVFALRR